MSTPKTASESEVALAAFHIWESEGRPDGRAEEHWHRARAMLEARETFDGAAPPSSPAPVTGPASASASAAPPPAPKARPATRRKSAETPARPRTPRKG